MTWVVKKVTWIHFDMASLRRLVKNPSEVMHSHGCQAHHMNLLAKECSAKLKNPIEQILDVTKHLRLHHAETAFLRQNNIPRPPLNSLELSVRHVTVFGRIWRSLLMQ